MKKNDYDFRSLFPIFKKYPRLVYFDTAATSLKPLPMIKALKNFYMYNGLSVRSQSFLLNHNNNLIIEKIRKKIANFFNASLSKEIIFTKSATESLNLIAQILGEQIIKPGDEIITSELEHNSSILPWFKIVQQKKASLVFIPLNSHQQITLENFCKVLTNKTKILVLTHVSNFLGHQTPIREIVRIAKQKHNIIVILDAAQSVGHMPLDVQELGVDFMAFSAHKMYGPFGLGVLYGKQKFLKQLNPTIIGGNSVTDVFFENFTLNTVPEKFEAGTPNIGSIVAFGQTLTLLQQIGFGAIKKHEQKLLYKLRKELSIFRNLKILNPLGSYMVTFNFDFIHAHDVESFLASDNICVRTGALCAHLLTKNIKQPSVIRISLGMHNNEEDIKILIQSLRKVEQFFIKY
ncbi:aminotransferase class V-fold PLP-dependent enzyme [Candidatus Phytoplasma phoenicium]|uniref:cysteine desulfurase n=1 Tax=Candidatus Phytoplasma phoenicium TaxID=198422 RepID=A0A2S8NU19_9MOLU|nr:aminotransferase class V-fold PLP-dependent enzyme [Candidatus Phytoplasma phoenicium]